MPRQSLGWDVGRSGSAGMRRGAAARLRHAPETSARGTTGRKRRRPAVSRLSAGRIPPYPCRVPTYRDQAVVLRTHQLGEADRIVTFLTRAHGKVRAVAKGVRRTSSKFGGRLEPFQHIDIQFAQGRGSLEVVTQVEALHASRIGRDYGRFTAAQVLVEMRTGYSPRKARPPLSSTASSWAPCSPSTPGRAQPHSSSILMCCAHWRWRATPWPRASAPSVARRK